MCTKKELIESPVDLSERAFLTGGSEKSTSENETCIFVVVVVFMIACGNSHCLMHSLV